MYIGLINAAYKNDAVKSDIWYIDFSFSDFVKNLVLKDCCLLFKLLPIFC